MVGHLMIHCCLVNFCKLNPVISTGIHVIRKVSHVNLPRWPKESCFFESDICVICVSYIATIPIIDNEISLMCLHL